MMKVFLVEHAGHVVVFPLRIRRLSFHIPHGAHVGSPADAFHYFVTVVWIFAGQEGIAKCVSVQQNSIVQVSRFSPNLYYTSHSCDKKECRRE